MYSNLDTNMCDCVFSFIIGLKFKYDNALKVFSVCQCAVCQGKKQSNPCNKCTITGQ